MNSFFAVVAIIISLLVFLHRNAQQAATERAANFKTCTLIVGILNSFHTSHGRASAKLILSLNPELRDCRRYAVAP